MYLDSAQIDDASNRIIKLKFFRKNMTLTL
jgi:hypothetical protein